MFFRRCIRLRACLLRLLCTLHFPDTHHSPAHQAFLPTVTRPLSVTGCLAGWLSWLVSFFSDRNEAKRAIHQPRLPINQVPNTLNHLYAAPFPALDIYSFIIFPAPRPLGNFPAAQAFHLPPPTAAGSKPVALADTLLTQRSLRQLPDQKHLEAIVVASANSQTNITCRCRVQRTEILRL